MEGFVLLETGRKVRILCAAEENSAVQCAVENLAGDIRKVCSCDVEICRSFPERAVRGETLITVATMDSGWYGRIMPSGVEPMLEKIRDGSGNGRWEAYLQQVCGDVFCIVGADRRGTVFGIYDLCEQIGVSPWYFWGDVPIRRKERFLLPADYQKADWPDVAYRGIFLNDEEELEAWAKRHTEDDTIGPQAYQRIFELILRLKGNYIWPAMHVDYFNRDPESGRLAERMGVVVGTSHCDMLLRSNQNEWKPWLVQKGYSEADVRYDYSIPGENRDRIREYWAESVEQNRDYEVCYTMGMRGIHDTGFVTEKIDREEALSAETRKEAKIRLLEQVISDQKQILKDVLGDEKGSGALQTFIPYKEVLDLYDGGLAVPEDVTLIWVDDNFGYMRRYPDKEEQKRKGGNGLYYHASYWAPPGMSYLFFNSIPLAQTGNELKKCWESGIRKMWVLNVGALKPLEMDMEFFLRYGWQAGREDGDTKDVDSFAAGWFDRNFSGGFGREAADIVNQFAQVNNACKPEHLKSGQFSQTAYGNEARRRVNQLYRLMARAEDIYRKLPEEERDAFFEMFLMKLQASWYINASFYYADRSRLLWSYGAMQAADGYLECSRKMDHRKQQMLYYYNEVMADGKWSGILTPESFSPPPTVLYPAAKPALEIGDPLLGAVCETGLTFEAYGEREKRILLFNRGCGETSFWVEAPDWLWVSETEGLVSEEKSLSIRVREECLEKMFGEGEGGAVVVFGTHGERFEFAAQAEKRGIPLPEKTPCYVEGNGCVSIPADGYMENHGSSRACWREVRHLGRARGNAMEAWTEEQNGGSFAAGEGRKNGCWLEYLFFLTHGGEFLLEIHRFLTLHPTGRIRFAVGVDGRAPVLVESETTDEWRGNWKWAVMNDGEKLLLQLPALEPGLHALKVFPVDRYVTMNRFVIYTGERRENNLGPVDSAFWDGENLTYPSDGNEVPEEWDGARRDFWENIYGNPKEEELLLPMLYADQDFWKSDRLYRRSDARENRLGRRKYVAEPSGRKNVFALFGSGPFVEKNGEIAIEAEYALKRSRDAWLTASGDGREWSHTQAETDGKTGLAMMIEGSTSFWNEPFDAPGMHYRIEVQNGGEYDVWLLMKFEDAESDSCFLALDQSVVEKDQMFCGKMNFFTYSMKQRWHWRAVCRLALQPGDHILSIYGRKPGLRIDRIFLTKDRRKWPPVDGDWREWRKMK